MFVFRITDATLFVTQEQSEAKHYKMIGNKLKLSLWYGQEKQKFSYILSK